MPWVIIAAGAIGFCKENEKANRMLDWLYVHCGRRLWGQNGQ